MPFNKKLRQTFRRKAIINFPKKFSLKESVSLGQKVDLWKNKFMKKKHRKKLRKYPYFFPRLTQFSLTGPTVGKQGKLSGRKSRRERCKRCRLYQWRFSLKTCLLNSRNKALKYQYYTAVLRKKVVLCILV